MYEPPGILCLEIETKRPTWLYNFNAPEDLDLLY